MTEKILLIEDEPDLTLALCERLRRDAYEVESAADAGTGFEKGATGEFDLIVLDVMLPGRSGVDVCRELRESGITTPVLMLTARSETVEKVVGLAVGADDYVTKPFEMVELLARIQALLRRAGRPARPPSGVVRFGSVRVDLQRAEVLKEGKRVALSAKEFQLLRYFLAHRGQTLSRQRLLNEVWNYSASSSSRTVDVHVAWLRQKFEDDTRCPHWIATVPGLGYRFLE